jgi:hypothetical protein
MHRKLVTRTEVKEEISAALDIVKDRYGEEAAKTASSLRKPLP